MSKSKFEKDMEKQGWKFIGVVGVDAGQVMVTDPCYIGSEWGEDEFRPTTDLNAREAVKKSYPYDYSGCCDASCNADQGGQLRYKMGHAGAGVCVSSGYGDGTYPVYVRYSEQEYEYEGKKFVDRRIAELRVVFIDDSEE